MPRYVDAEKELAEMKFSWYPQDMDMTNAIGMYEDFLKNAPSADVAPIIHAHWIERQLSAYGEYEFCCSNCENINYGYDTPGNYCNNCGAKMDEVIQ